MNRGIAVLKKLRYSLPRKSLITIYKALLSPLLDYGAIIYDQPHNELGLESLRARRWYNRLSCMFEIVKKEAPNYLINWIPKIQQTTRTRINRMPTFHCHRDYLKNSFFPATLNDWYK